MLREEGLGSGGEWGNRSDFRRFWTKWRKKSRSGGQDPSKWRKSRYKPWEKWRKLPKGRVAFGQFCEMFVKNAVDGMQKSRYDNRGMLYDVWKLLK
ncbi:hypothetical protein [Oscillibacter sp. CAG:155]|uniref:hypothetical protein n=1 Tax=Oscillibacter sp. CAG:155 TaxID=1262910 RepID=UPI000B015593|nr:hypothetical protein [Oscillibacter sp. CAG:155]